MTRGRPYRLMSAAHCRASASATFRLATMRYVPAPLGPFVT